MLISIATDSKRQVVDITEDVQSYVSGEGLVNIFLKHTTAAVTIADLDPGTDQDYLNAIEAMTPKQSWRHPHDPSHFPDHLWSAVIGPSVSLPFNDGQLQLGSWQRVVLIELDGPRERELEISVIKT
jgi:secondary thiamine-phosphate synthase enzyme